MVNGCILARCHGVSLALLHCYLREKPAVAPECRFPPGGRVSIPLLLQKPHTGRRTAEKRGFAPPKQIPDPAQKPERRVACIFTQTEFPLPRVEKKAAGYVFVKGKVAAFLWWVLNNHAFFRSRQEKNEYASQALGCAFECGCRFQGLILGFSCVRCCREYNTAYYPAERRR